MRRPSLIALVLCALCACRVYDMPTAAESFGPCCGTAGTCVPQGLIPKDVRSQLGADRCGSSLLCVPSALAGNPNYVPATCRATGNVEGRCLPACLPAFGGQASAFERGTCAADELCAPCYDPRTGEATPACHLGADPGPIEPARLFASCCGGRAKCVPASYASRLASGADRQRLGSGSCADASDTCVPTAWMDAKPKSVSCEAPGGLEGRCLLDCIPDVMKQAGQLSRASCSSGEFCVPCFNPLTAENTGVCTQGDDRPARPAKTFPQCCNLGGKPRGRCLPRELTDAQVSVSDAQQLGRDTCAANESCVPEAWVDPDAPPVKCQAAGALEGRCMSRCLPMVGDQAESLDVSTCDPTEACVPCFDPRTGKDTGACRIGTDKPDGPPAKFDPCCGKGNAAEGQCVPKKLLSANAADDQVALLGRDNCADPESACVPKDWVNATEIELTPCRTFGILEGRCMPTCLPQVSERDTLRRESCRVSERCVPCYSPQTGVATGACSIGRDQPDEPPAKFPTCCSGSGRCMPGALLEGALDSTQLSALGRDSCEAADARCVPSELLEETMPKTCRSAGDLEGRCMSECLTAVAEQSMSLPRDSCATRQRCVPCYDPRDGKDTGICRTGSDEPAEAPPGEYPTCCRSTGRCVPGSLLEGRLGSLPPDALGRNTCSDASAKCVPSVLLEQTAPPKSCHVPGNFEGRCLSDCMPIVAAQAARLVRAECSASELCVPCYEPQTLEPTGVCSIGRDMPAEPPPKFDACCGTGVNALGLCLPVEYLTSEQRQLPRDSCRTYDSRCIPRQLFEAPVQPLQSCRTGLGARGVCFEQCFLAGLSTTLTGALVECGVAGRCVACSLLDLEGVGCD